jgi:hypothetical protein
MESEYKTQAKFNALTNVIAAIKQQNAQFDDNTLV